MRVSKEARVFNFITPIIFLMILLLKLLDCTLSPKQQE